MQYISKDQLRTLLALISSIQPKLHDLTEQYDRSSQYITTSRDHYSIKFVSLSDGAPINSVPLNMMINLELQSERYPSTVLIVLYIINSFIDTLDLFVGDGGALPPVNSYFVKDEIAPWVKYKLTIL